MKNFLLVLALVAGIGIGWGIFSLTSETSNDRKTEITDPYAAWTTIYPGNVISLKIPPGCVGDPGAGSIYVVCATPDGSDPLPSMVTSSDGVIVNIRRYEGAAWKDWDKVIASIAINTPVREGFRLTIEK